MNEHYKLYVVAELNYIDKHKDKQVGELFPVGWYELKDYEFKVKVLIQAIKENILVNETKLYRKLVACNYE